LENQQFHEQFPSLKTRSKQHWNGSRDASRFGDASPDRFPKFLPTDGDAMEKLLHGDEYGQSISGWWYTYPSEKYEFVSWDDDSQYMEK